MSQGNALVKVFELISFQLFGLLFEFPQGNSQKNLGGKSQLQQKQ